MKERIPQNEVYQLMRENSELHADLKRQYRGLLFKMVGKELRGTDCPFEELFQFAEWALLEIWFSSYDPSKGSFVTHLRWALRGKLQIYLRETGYGKYRTKESVMRQEALFFRSHHHRDPTHAELAAITGHTESRVAALLAPPATLGISLDAELEGGGLMHESIPDAGPLPDQALELRQEEEFRRALLAHPSLLEREKQMIRDLCGFDAPPLSESQLATKLGLSKQGINFRKQVLIRKLRVVLGGEGRSETC